VLLQWNENTSACYPRRFLAADDTRCREKESRKLRRLQCQFQEQELPVANLRDPGIFPESSDGKNHSKKIVSLKHFALWCVMVFVQDPQKAMHNIFMRKPRHKFHEQECTKTNEN
jgi:hypothetical protein